MLAKVQGRPDLAIIITALKNEECSVLVGQH